MPYKFTYLCGFTNRKIIINIPAFSFEIWQICLKHKANRMIYVGCWYICFCRLLNSLAFFFWNWVVGILAFNYQRMEILQFFCSFSAFVFVCVFVNSILRREGFTLSSYFLALKCQFSCRFSLKNKLRWRKLKHQIGSSIPLVCRIVFTKHLFAQF